jgi:hypothetical protein
MDDQTFNLYWRILRVAMQRETITYRTLAEQTGLPTEGHQLGQTLAPFLDRINIYERAHGRPLLSAVVVREANGRPGPGFFGFALQVGELTLGEEEETFWARQIAAIRRTWV